MIHRMFFSSIGRLVVTGALCVAVFVLSGFSQSTVTINVNNATNVVPNQMFGTLMERLGRQWSGSGAIFVGTASTIPNTNGMRNDVINGFRECGVGAAQWPGGCAALGYIWNPPNPANDVGTDRFLQFCQLTGAEPLICGPQPSASASSNLAWIKHIDSVTAQRGMDSLRWFKIGNEVWGGCATRVEAAAYCTNFNAHYNLIHAYRPSPSLKLEGGSENEDRGYAAVAAYYNTQISTLGTRLDGVEYHDYIFHPGNIHHLNFTTEQYWHLMHDGLIGDFAGHVRTNLIPSMDAADPSKRVKVVLDEWGDWLQGADNWMQAGTLTDALSAANQLHLIMGHTDRITVACLAQGVNVIQSLLNINTSGQMIKTPTFYIFKMYKPHHANGARWAPITSSTIQTTTVNSFETGTITLPLMTVGSTVDNNGRVNISVNNIDLTASRQIIINLTSNAAQYVIDSAQIITGPAMNSNNPFGGAEVVNLQNFAASNYTLTNNGKTITATLPARSIVMFRLMIPVAVQPGSYLKNSADAFSVKAGPRGTVLVTSSVSQKMPVTMSLYGVDGRTLVESFAGTLEPGQKSLVWRPKNPGMGTNVYIVKVKSGEVTKSQRVVF